MLSDRPGLRTKTEFYKVFDARKDPLGPVNPGAIRRDASVVVQAASKLLEYVGHLAQAREAKAKKRRSGQDFEREIQVQARLALNDVRELAKAGVRTTRHLYSAGIFEQVLSTWREAVGASGPVRINDIVADLLSDSNVRRGFGEQGVTEQMQKRIFTVLEKMSGTVTVQNGTLALEFILPGKAQVVRVPLRSGHPRQPRDLGELLARGSFHRTAELFDRTGGYGLDVVPGKSNSTFEVPEIMLAGAVFGLQQFGGHVRKLEDTGLATYQGDDPGSFLLALFVGFVLVTLSYAFCKADVEPLCGIFLILLFLGTALLIELCGTGVWQACALGIGLILYGKLLDYNSEQDAQP